MNITKSNLRPELDARRLEKRIIKWSLIILLIGAFILVGNADKLILTI
jgi:hypothetical protein